MASWLAQVTGYATWVTDAGRLPRTDGNDTEMRWAAWAENETRLAGMSVTRCHELILRVPYLLDPRLAPDVVALAQQAQQRAQEREVQRLENAWQDRFASYLDWCTTHGRRPSKTTTDPVEAGLAAWFADQRPSTLTEQRATTLDQHFPLRDGSPRAHHKILGP
jgi:hypothetical protein